MALIVQKFGGTSVATVDLVKKAALRVKAEVDAGNQVVVVVSAMGGLTDTLVGYVHELSSTYDRAEYDIVTSAGEQVTAGLLAMALKNMGLEARSWLGWQIPIKTTPMHSQARIEEIPQDKIQASLNEGSVAVVAGFQGICPEGRVTTLGRGGSDTTAVALASFLKAERCDIFTDVDGVYTADPRYVSKADKLEKIAYQEMLELASQGAKVLQRDCVELAMKQRVPLRVLSSLSNKPGTMITQETAPSPNQIRGVVQNSAYGKIILEKLPPHSHEKVKSALAQEGVNFEMACQTLSPCGTHCQLSFAVADAELKRAEKVLEYWKENLKYKDIKIIPNIAKISIIGPSLSEVPSLAQKLFHTLSEKGIQVQDVSTSDIKVSVLVHKSETEKALSALHTAYNLDAKDS